MKRFVLAGLGLAVLGIGACSVLLPERYAVNAPLLHLVFGVAGNAPAPETVASAFRLPEGLSMGLFASELPNVRFLRFTSAGDLLASRTRAGEIVWLEADRDRDGRSDGRRTLLEGLNQPHGMDFHDGWLYVAETDGVGRIRFDARAGRTDGEYTRVVKSLPEGGSHYTRTLRFGPDGWMYVSVGSSCNVCEEEDSRRAAILRFRPDGSGQEIYATGLRNAVGFDWQPGTDALYATDNGRDLLGDDFPPCELNRVVEGGFYGFPYANGDRVADPDLGGGQAEAIARSIPPAHSFRAHNAPLGIAFVRGDALPGFRGAALVALHGSWNRSQKDGYRVVSLHWDAQGGIQERDFISGFETDGRVLGRPVDVVEGPDGASYISDDYAGSIYRVARGGASTTTPSARPTGSTDPLAALGAEERATSVTRGAALAEAHPCAGCHDPARAEPGVVVAPLSKLTTRYDIDGLAAFLATPTPPMPVYPLDAKERRDLAIHLLDAHP
jgi:glucose/arabinose dehydrogenase